ncbi:hypothetical protein GCM10009642_17720 [Nocardiopsis metallicus]
MYLTCGDVDSAGGADHEGLPRGRQRGLLWRYEPNGHPLVHQGPIVGRLVAGTDECDSDSAGRDEFSAAAVPAAPAPRTTTWCVDMTLLLLRFA